MVFRQIGIIRVIMGTSIPILPVNLACQWRQSVFYHKMRSFCIYKKLKRISILCYGEFMESAILHNIRCWSFSVDYKCRRIPSYELKYTLTSLSSKVDREYTGLLYSSIMNFPSSLGVLLCEPRPDIDTLLCSIGLETWSAYKKNSGVGTG